MILISYFVILGIILAVLIYNIIELKDAQKKIKEEIFKTTKENLESLLDMLEQHREGLDREVIEVSKMYLEEIKDMLSEYKDHLQTISEFETYSGDDIITNLLKHTKDIIKNIDEFEKIKYEKNETSEVSE